MKKQHSFIIILILLACNIVWFIGIAQKGILMGDDLKLYSFFEQSTNGFTAILGNNFDNYRPVANLFFLCQIKAFGNSYLGYFLFNLSFNMTIIVSLYYVLAQLCDGHSLYPFFAAFSYIISPCAYYGITQVYGIMELLCILEIIWLLHYGILYLREGNRTNYYMIVVLYGLMIFTHERFMTVLGILLVVLIIKKEKKAMRWILAFVPLLSNFIIKTFFFHSKFLMGTSSSDMEFNINSIFTFAKQAILMIFGINTGPVWLNAYTFTDAEFLEKIVLAIAGLLQVLVVVLFIYLNVIKEDKQLRRLQSQYFILGITGCTVTIVAFCVTIRLEMRWVYAPYTIYLLFWSYILYKLKITKRIKVFILFICLSSSLVFALKFRNYYNELFFVRAMNIAQSLYEATIQEYGEKLNESVLIIEYQNELVWAMQDKAFFNMFLEDEVELKIADDETQVLKLTESYEQQGKNVKCFKLGADLVIQETYSSN